MSAITYLNPPKIDLKKPSVQLHYTEAQTLNYSIICFLNRDIADNFEWIFENKLIMSKDIKYFTKLADRDVNFLEGLYRKKNKMQDFEDDFYYTQAVFTNLANKDLSEFQRKEKMIVEVLTTIYELRFIKNNLSSIINSGAPEPNTMRILNEKLEELESVFLNLFSKVSNKKTFDFNKNKNFFDAIKSMKYDEFKNILK